MMEPVTLGTELWSMERAGSEEYAAEPAWLELKKAAFLRFDMDGALIFTINTINGGD